MSTGENLRAGERRNVTVLFADMKDFTSLSERMDPEEMDGLMGEIFGTFESIVHRYGGIVEKYIGDALVAVFGVPTLHEDDPARAINAALDYLTEVERLNRARGKRQPIAFRMGINTGLITTGKRGEHDVVTGHPMAVASRLESAAATNSILISASTHDRCEQDFLYSEAILVRAKGKEEGVTAYEVVGRNVRPVSDDSIFIGRKDVLDRMLRDFLRHDPNRTGGYLIVGEAGIGKSRVGQEFIRKIGRLPDFNRETLFARAQRYGTRPFAVVIDLLSHFFQLDAQMSEDEIAASVQSAVGVEPKTAAGFASLVEGTSDDQDNQAFVILYLILKSIVKRNIDAPYATLLCVDDVNFMDRLSRDFFQFYLRNADARPYFLFLDRSLDPAFREVFHELEVVELASLDREETLQLVRALANEDLDMEIVNSINDNARGNPLFIREYVRYARENRDAQALPSTIQNIFLTSIESYDSNLRDLLKKLSVFAHSFSIADAEHVQRVTDGDPQLVEAATSFFLRESILIQEDDLFMFKYDLFKKALYSSLLNYNKKILHRVIAELMEQKGNPNPLRLMHHLFRSDEYERAADTLVKAPNATSNVEYLRYVDRLLAQFEERDFDRYMRLLFLKSAILFNNGITEEADSLLKGMIEMAVSKVSPLYAGSAYHLLTAYNMKAYCFGKARYCGRKALAFYQRAGNGSANLQNVLEIMASSELLSSNHEAVDRIIAEIRALESSEGVTFSPHRLQTSLAEHALMRGEYRVAIDLIRAALHDIPEGSETWYSAHLLLGLGYFAICDWAEMKEVDQVVLEGPSRHLSNISQMNARLAVADHFLNDDREADRRFQQAEFSASQIRNDFDLVDACRTISGCYLIRGNTDQARKFALRGLTTSLRHTVTYPVLSLLMVLVDIAFAEGAMGVVDFYLQEADLLVDSGVLVPNRERVLYHYYRMRRSEDSEERDRHRARANDALRQETRAIADDALIATFLELPTYARVHRDLNS